MSTIVSLCVFILFVCMLAAHFRSNRKINILNRYKRKKYTEITAYKFSIKWSKQNIHRKTNNKTRSNTYSLFQPTQMFDMKYGIKIKYVLMRKHSDNIRWILYRISFSVWYVQAAHTWTYSNSKVKLELWLICLLEIEW